MFKGKNETIREYYNSLNINQKANLIGISQEMLNDLKVNKKNNKKKNNSVLKGIFKNINSISNIETFNQELFLKLYFVGQYGTLTPFKNTFVGIYSDEFNRYIINLSIENNKIQYFITCSYNEDKIKKEATLAKFPGNTIVESKIDRKSTENSSFIIIQSYDQFGCEEFRHTFEKKDKYEKMIDLWRIKFSPYVLRREKLEFTYHETKEDLFKYQNRNICSIGTVDKNFAKDLVINDDFQEFDPKLYHKYIQGKCKIKDILESITCNNNLVRKKKKI